MVRWELSRDTAGWSKIVCKPGQTTDLIDQFVTELTGRRASVFGRRTAGHRVVVPSQPIRNALLQPQTG